MDIVKNIEKLRKQLNKMGNEKGFRDPGVIKLSQKLDKLINTYYKMESSDMRATG